MNSSSSLDYLLSDPDFCRDVVAVKDLGFDFVSMVVRLHSRCASSADINDFATDIYYGRKDPAAGYTRANSASLLAGDQWTPEELSKFKPGGMIFLTKEPPVFIQTKTYLNGQDISTMPKEAIFAAIADKEAKAAKLSEIKHQPASLKAELAKIEKDITDLVAYLDSQEKKDDAPAA